jgi:hypothetical protein
MILKLHSTPMQTLDETTPAHVNPMQWQQSLGLARQVCARVFRDGGKPADALAAFGLAAPAQASWDKVVEMIAEAMSRSQSRTVATRQAA